MNKTKGNAFNKRRVHDLIFCLLVILVPTVQFCIFYIGVNFNSVAMAFQRYEIVDNKGIMVFNGLANFKKLFNEVRYDAGIITAFKNSLIVFLVSIGLGTTLSLFFSVYIYKGMFASKTFRVFLFLPSILSATITFTMKRKYF